MDFGISVECIRTVLYDGGHCKRFQDPIFNSILEIDLPEISKIDDRFHRDRTHSLSAEEKCRRTVN